jgi:hypothetical protein
MEISQVLPVIFVVFSYHTRAQWMLRNHVAAAWVAVLPVLERLHAQIVTTKNIAHLTRLYLVAARVCLGVRGCDRTQSAKEENPKTQLGQPAQSAEPYRKM